MEHIEIKHVQLKVQELLKWSKLQQEQLSQAILITKDTVLGFLKRQLEQGNMDAVKDMLHGKPMTKAGNFMLKELRSRVVHTLVMRLGLRKVLALGLAIILIPFILVKVAAEVVGKYKGPRLDQEV